MAGRKGLDVLMEGISKPHIKTKKERQQLKEKRDVLLKNPIYAPSPEEIYEVSIDAYGRKIFSAKQTNNPLLFKVNCPFCSSLASVCVTTFLKHDELYVVCNVCESASFLKARILVPFLKKNYMSIVPESWDQEKIDKLVFFFEIDHSKEREEINGTTETTSTNDNGNQKTDRKKRSSKT